MKCQIKYKRDARGNTVGIHSVKAPNGSRSLLYDTLQESFGESKALSIYRSVNTDNMSKVLKNVELDKNGEPLIDNVGNVRLRSEISRTYDTSSKFDKELADDIQNKLQELYPEIKLDITSTPVWEEGEYVFNQDIESKINSFELFEDIDKLCPTGICNLTAKESTEFLSSIGLNPYHTNYNGSQLPVTVKSPLGDFNITHYVSAVAIDGQIYIYDMPQNEFISNEFFGLVSEVKVKESYKPRLIPLTLDDIKVNYNLSLKEAGYFIHSILNARGWQGADENPGFREYIRANIKDSVKYIDLLESQIESSGYEVKQWNTEDYIKEIEEYKLKKTTSPLSKEEEQKVIRYYENKLKIRTRDYAPRTVDSFRLKDLVDSVLGKGFDHAINNDSFTEALDSLNEYLKSETFIDELLTKVKHEEEEVLKTNNTINKVYDLSRLFASFTKQVRVHGIEEAVKKYDSYQQYTLRTMLPSNILERYKSKEQAALVLQKYWGNKDNIVKKLNIMGAKSFTDLMMNKLRVNSVFNKYQTVLNFLKSTEFDSYYLYQVISNEAIRRYSYFANKGNIQFQKDELSRTIGQANINAMTVVIDAVNQKQDTLPHEYAHHYIAWFRDTPMVQEAIKKWGSEEALVQSIGEQVVKQKGEAYGWWNNFVKWILNKFNSLTTLKKEELTQVLTDAFLTRQNLNSEKFGKIKINKSNKLLNIITGKVYELGVDFDNVHLATDKDIELFPELKKYRDAGRELGYKVVVTKDNTRMDTDNEVFYVNPDDNTLTLSEHVNHAKRYKQYAKNAANMTSLARPDEVRARVMYDNFIKNNQLDIANSLRLAVLNNDVKALEFLTTNNSDFTLDNLARMYHYLYDSRDTLNGIGRVYFGNTKGNDLLPHYAELVRLNPDIELYTIEKSPYKIKELLEDLGGDYDERMLKKYEDDMIMKMATTTRLDRSLRPALYDAIDDMNRPIGMGSQGLFDEFLITDYDQEIIEAFGNSYNSRVDKIKKSLELDKKYERIVDEVFEDVKVDDMTFAQFIGKDLMKNKKPSKDYDNLMDLHVSTDIDYLVDVVFSEIDNRVAEELELENIDLEVTRENIQSAREIVGYRNSMNKTLRDIADFYTVHNNNQSYGFINKLKPDCS